MEKKVYLKGMKPKDKVAYIWEYYKLPIIAVILVGAFLFSFLWHFVTKKEVLANVMVVNAIVQDREDEQDMFSDFLKKEGYNAKKQQISLNDSLFVDPSSSDSSSMYSYQSLQTIMIAGGVDVFLSDEKLFDDLNKNTEFKDLSTILDPSTLEKYKDSIIMATDEETKTQYPSGIILKNNAWVEKKGLYKQDAVIGISISSKNDKVNKQILDMILGENVK